MDRLENIVVGVDMSACSKNALMMALRIAKWNGARLHVLHVVSSQVIADLCDALPVPEAEIEADACKSAQSHLQEFIDSVDPGDAEIDAKTVAGEPFVELLKTVRRTTAGLMVLGARGHSTPVGTAGSVATRCVRKAPTRVMLVRKTQTMPFARVVACVDYSDMSKPVLEHAIRVAKHDGCPLHLLHVFDPPWRHVHYATPTTEVAPDFRKKYRQVLEDRLADLVTKYESELEGIETEVHLLESTSAGYRIIKFVEGHDMNLVVVGTRGRTGLISFLLGTTAERVVRESTSSVLAVKPEGFTYEA